MSCTSVRRAQPDLRCRSVHLARSSSLGEVRRTKRDICRQQVYDYWRHDRGRCVRCFFLLAETWQTASEDYACLDIPGSIAAEAKVNRDGVAVIISNGWRHKIIASPLKTNTFVSVCFTIYGNRLRHHLCSSATLPVVTVALFDSRLHASKFWNSTKMSDRHRR